MSARPLLTRVALVGLCVLLLAPSAAQAMTPGPASILGRYAHTYNARASEMLDGLYAEDYEAVVVAPPQVIFMDRTTTMESATNMIEDEETSRVVLTFESGYDVAEAGPGAWRIENLKMTLRLEFVEGSSKGVADHEVTTCVTLYVRESTGDLPFEIFREVVFEGCGCEEK